MQLSCNKSDLVLCKVVEGIEGTTTFVGGVTGPRDVSGPRKALTSWLKRHCAVLQWACVNAFEVKDHPEMGLDHVFLIQLKTVIQSTSRKQTPQLQINNAALVDRTYLMQAYPGVASMFARQNESDEINGKVDGTVSYSMLVRSDAKWHLQKMTWDQGEFDGLERQKDWVDVLLSITKGMKEFKMVDGNPVRW